MFDFISSRLVEMDTLTFPIPPVTNLSEFLLA